MGIAGMVIWALTAGIGIYLLAVGISAQRAAGLVRARAAAAAAAPTARADSIGASAAGTARTASVGAVAVGATQADSAGAEVADRAAAAAASGTDGPAPAGTDSARTDSARTDSAGTDSAGTDSTAVGTQALAVVMSGGPAPAAPPEGSPLLEFSHPALALLGLTFWIFFVMTGDRLFAWIAFGVVVATIAAGLSWELSRRRTVRQRAVRRVTTAAPGSGPDSGGPDSSGPDSSGPDSSGPDGAADGPGFPPHLVLVHGAAAACTFALVVIAAVAAGHG